MSNDKDFTNAALMYTELSKGKQKKEENEKEVLVNKDMMEKINEMHEFMFGNKKFEKEEDNGKQTTYAKFKENEEQIGEGEDANQSIMTLTEDQKKNLFNKKTTPTQVKSSPKMDKYVDYSDNNLLHKIITEEVSFNDKDLEIVEKRIKRLQDPSKGFFDKKQSYSNLNIFKLIKRGFKKANVQ
jgi:hypothetical protein